MIFSYSFENVGSLVDGCIDYDTNCSPQVLMNNDRWPSCKLKMWNNDLIATENDYSNVPKTLIETTTTNCHHWSLSFPSSSSQTFVEIWVLQPEGKRIRYTRRNEKPKTRAKETDTKHNKSQIRVLISEFCLLQMNCKKNSLAKGRKRRRKKNAKGDNTDSKKP